MSIFSDTFVCQENPLNMLFIHVDVYSSHVANHFVSVMLFTAPPACAFPVDTQALAHVISDSFCFQMKNQLQCFCSHDIEKK